MDQIPAVFDERSGEAQLSTEVLRSIAMTKLAVSYKVSIPAELKLH